ncbi:MULTISPECIES: hypothetical protein [unclassified Lactococcus]|uniref:hypothetical protein n=1 Tax=unclassified Lactococcus TaxID=2643510 RepID=UPI0011C76D09|nr:MULTISPECIES: hypothetical protein [unclassified Lactococcus]MQW22908.1 hypothetical protein [Lactococcus sp. dk101]TXK44545.1 hypothetical protein FVP42_04650 [Lactococcus sp. dk310]TXK50398.1 hypothetical protein FVP43_04620 [Lactococcus sp. dk322]
MLKLKIRMTNGGTYDDEFENVSEFVSLMLDDFPPMDDADEILDVEIDGEKYEFSGTANELYYELVNKK